MNDKSITLPDKTKLKWFEKDYKNYLNKTTIVYGRTNSGKSTIIEEIMYLCKDYIPTVFVIAPTNSSNNAYTNKIPTSVEELELLSTDAFLQSTLRGQNVGKIAIAYTVWSKKKGGGKLIVKEVYKKIKRSNHLNRLVTLSPLTEMASKFHTRNGAKLIQVNDTTQNFEYKVM